MVIRSLSRTRWKCALIYLISWLASTGALAFTLSVDDAHPFGIYYDDETPLTVANNAAKTEILFEIPEKHYLYKESIAITLDDDRIKADLILPDAEKKQDSFQKREVDVYYHQLVIPVALTFAGSPPATITGTVSYQGCSHELCFRLMRQKFAFQVAGAAVAATTSPASGDGGFLSLFAANDFATILNRGLGTALLMTFLAGILTGFTPCVLPVIPLTLAFMGVTDHQKGVAKFASLSVFVLGLIMTYASLGILSAMIGKTFGFWFQSPIFMVFLALFFLAMGLEMLGAFTLSVPAAWQNKIVSVKPKGYLRELYSGLTIGAIAAPCVGPIAGPLLVYVSISKNLLLGGSLMTSYALGLGSLFFALGFLSREWVRRFGAKSAVLKRLVGFSLIAVAGFYGYVFAKPYVVAKKPETFFKNSYAAAADEAKISGKGLLVDFYADWCLPCQEWNDVWSNTKAKTAISKRFIPVKIDCTNETKACKEAVDKYGVIGWPTIIFVDPRQSEIKGKRLVGQVMDAGEFVDYLSGVSF